MGGAVVDGLLRAVELEKPEGEAAGEAVAAPPPGRQLRRTTLAAILIASIPMVGAWSASKWMIPWADAVAGPTDAAYKAVTQGWWAAGSLVGSFVGALLAGWLGRRASYFLISVGATAATLAMFNLTAPLEPGFHSTVCVQGFVSTLFFGWLAVYLPSVFPVEVRAAWRSGSRPLSSGPGRPDQGQVVRS